MPRRQPEPTRSSPWAVQASAVSRRFGDHVVLDHLDLEIRPDEFVALLGRSGGGKSTLLRILGGLDTEHDGDVWVPRRRSVVFQEPRLAPWLRVAANVTIGLDAGRGGRRRLREVADAALAEVGLTGHRDAWPVTLSGGEAQRVALARSLVREPELLLLDEPFGALDALTRARMHQLLKDLCATHRPAVLLVTHDVHEATLLADRVLVLKDGRITTDVTIAPDQPRSADHPDMARLRARLLAELGVDPGSVASR